MAEPVEGAVSRFLGEPLLLEKSGPQRWRVARDVRFYWARVGAVYVVPVGYETDLASIPQWAQWLLPKVGRYDGASVLHDASYTNSLLVEDAHGYRQPVRLIKPLCDALLRDAALVCGVKGRTAWALYAAVRIGGQKRPEHRP